MSIRSWNEPVAVSAIIIKKEATLLAKARLLLACKGHGYEVKRSGGALSERQVPAGQGKPSLVRHGKSPFIVDSMEQGNPVLSQYFPGNMFQ